MLALLPWQAKHAFAFGAFAKNVRFAVAPFVLLQLEKASDLALGSQIPRVLAPTCREIARQHTEQRINDDGISQKVNNIGANEQIDDEHHQIQHQQGAAEYICAVSPDHKGI